MLQKGEIDPSVAVQLLSATPLKSGDGSKKRPLEGGAEGRPAVPPASEDADSDGVDDLLATAKKAKMESQLKSLLPVLVCLFVCLFVCDFLGHTDWCILGCTWKFRTISIKTIGLLGSSNSHTPLNWSLLGGVIRLIMLSRHAYDAYVKKSQMVSWKFQNGFITNGGMATIWLWRNNLKHATSTRCYHDFVQTFSFQSKGLLMDSLDSSAARKMEVGWSSPFAEHPVLPEALYQIQEEEYHQEWQARKWSCHGLVFKGGYGQGIEVECESYLNKIKCIEP